MFEIEELTDSSALIGNAEALHRVYEEELFGRERQRASDDRGLTCAIL